MMTDSAYLPNTTDSQALPIPRLIAFDLDDTLAPSKSRVPDKVLHLLVQLLTRTEVAVISGGAITQFQKQLLEPLEQLPDASPCLGRGILMAQVCHRGRTRSGVDSALCL